MPSEIRAALQSIPDSIVLSHLFCQMPEKQGWRERRYTKDKLTVYASEKYAWIDSTYMSLHKATTPEVQHAANLIHAMNKEGLPETLSMPSAEKITSHSLAELNSRGDSIRLTNLLRANDTWGGKGRTLFISETNNPHMTDSYCNCIELTRREFSYLMGLIPALNRDGLPQELNP